MTETQRKCLEFIEAFEKREGRCPTVAQITKGMGWGGPGPPGQTLNVLADKGLILFPMGQNFMKRKVSIFREISRESSRDETIIVKAAVWP